MSRNYSIQSFLGVVVIGVSLISASCGTSAKSRFYGKTEAPTDNTLRYVSGSEPESLDPQIPTGQPEARVLMSLYDGLLEYNPKTMEPMPSVAESWEIGSDGTEYLFHLRKNAKFSNGEAITAKDFVYTFRRGMSPELTALNAYLGFYIKYAEAYNGGRMFLKGADGNFLLKKDFADEAEPAVEAKTDNFGADTEFHRFLDAPERLTVEGSPFDLAKATEGNEKLKTVFKFKTADFKNVGTFVGNIKNGTDGVSKLLQEKLGKSLDACVSDCDNNAKQVIADGLNKIIGEESLHKAEVLNGVTLTKDAEKIVKSFDGANKKVEDANKILDEEIAKSATDEEKQAKEKKRKKPLVKLFYANRFLLNEIYADSLEKPQFTPVEAKDIGVEAVDDYTLRLKLYQPAPFFIGLIPHQFFRVVHQATIEKFKKDWVKPENIVTAGSFKLVTHRPYDVVVVEKDKNNWDAANVRLDRIEFYPLEEATTMMNLYKANSIYAIYNHTPPAAWNEVVREYKDEYLNLPEVANEYYTFNVKKAPTDNIKVRQALAYAIDRVALSEFRKTPKPLYNFVPERILPKYDEARDKIFAEKLKENNIAPEEWKKRIFDPEIARKLLGEAGYPVEKKGNGWSCPKFPVDKISVTYNTAESNKSVAEFMQAQWQQNLGIQVPLKNMEWKTFLPVRKALDYQGMARAGWVGDYMDPYTFLNLCYHEENDSSTGWHNAEFDKLLDSANKELDPQKRFEILAKAEFLMLREQPFLPLQTSATNWIKKPFIKGLYPNPGTLHAWKFVYIEQDPTKWDTNVENIMQTDDAEVNKQIEQLTNSQKTFSTQKAEVVNTAKAK
jgi:oligopeptide transport system substrate-binding protein